MILSVIYAQDRSLIFTTGSPIGTEGYTIQSDGTSGQSVSDRIHISGNMVLEALKIYAVADTEPAMARVLLQTDNGGIPGEEIEIIEYPMPDNKYKEMAKKLTTMRSKDYTDLLPEKIAEEFEALGIIPILLDDEIQMILPYHIIIE